MEFAQPALTLLCQSIIPVDAQLTTPISEVSAKCALETQFCNEANVYATQAPSISAEHVANAVPTRAIIQPPRAASV